MTEFRLYDDPGADVAEITTDGDTIKPFTNVIGSVVGECKLHITPDGLSVKAVDPANVFMGDVQLDASAFDAFDVTGEHTVGMNVAEFKKIVRRARKRSDDELTLSISERELTATVSRGYQNHNVVSQGTMTLIDPDSIRSEPDIPELDRDVCLNIDASPLLDALNYSMGVADHTKIAVKGVNQHTNALYIGGETDTRWESAAIDSIDCDATAESMYSNDYVRDILSGLSQIDADVITLQMDGEFPASFIAGTEELSVEYLIAPRIRSD